jgi:hypothetical protein
MNQTWFSWDEDEDEESADPESSFLTHSHIRDARVNGTETKTLSVLSTDIE